MYHASPHLTYLLQTDLLKPDVSKLNYPLYPPWDWAEKSFRCYSHSANPLLTGVPAEGFGLLIVSARLQMFQPVKVRCYEISKTVLRVFESCQDSCRSLSRQFQDLSLSGSDTEKDSFPGTKRNKSLEKMPGRFPGTVDSKWGSCRSCRQVKKISSFLKKVLFFC